MLCPRSNIAEPNQPSPAYFPPVNAPLAASNPSFISITAPTVPATHGAAEATALSPRPPIALPINPVPAPPIALPINPVPAPPIALPAAPSIAEPAAPEPRPSHLPTFVPPRILFTFPPIIPPTMSPNIPPESPPDEPEPDFSFLELMDLATRPRTLSCFP